jgi:hypothetical protein
LSILVENGTSGGPLPGAQADVRRGPEQNARIIAGALTDSAGHAEFNAPLDTYYLRIMLIGFRGGEIEVTIRAGTVDTIHAVLETSAVC